MVAQAFQPVLVSDSGIRYMITMRTILAMLLAIAGFAQSSRSPIAIAGEFSNMRYTAEHAYGYSIQLWREGSAVFGLFLASDGLAGDTPAGVLENVKFDSATGKLSFQAKLTMGMDIVAGKEQPSRDLFEFEGRLNEAALAGILRHSDRLQTEPNSQAERIRLRRRAGSSMQLPRSYDEWKMQTSEILKLRGPKW